MTTSKISYYLFAIISLLSFNVLAGEYHVSVNGNNDNNGTAESPFRTISQASKLARAGDTITVHAGTYREWVDPAYGGTSHLSRIVYQAAEGEEVIIKGSEVIKGWDKVEKGVWKVTLSNSFFGDYNPYGEIIVADWFRDFGRDHHTGEVYLNGKSFYEIDSLEKVIDPEPLKGAQDQEGSKYQWYCEINTETTTIWANFHGFNPNQELVEINVRPSVFFPKETGINYITVSGFIMSQAATTWAPPTSKQTGLIGPNWSKSWIIENNTISDSKCSGISLGKDRSTGQNYSLEYKKKSGHISQLEVVFRAIRNGWSKDNIGSHIVRNNDIYNCGQTGIVGNMGAIFSEINGNHIHDIYTKRQWGGFEMAGIKLHVPIDVVIKNNHIHNTFKGMWIDWQAQGLRITGNLMYDNSWMDIHLEVSHGPHIVDNNILLSDLNLWNLAIGSAFINNLFAGQICKNPESERFTPYHFPHSTQITGMMTSMVGDDRFINNIFIKTPVPSYSIFENARRPKRAEGMMDFGLGIYDNHPAVLKAEGFPIEEMSTIKLPVNARNNVYFNGAIPLNHGINEVAIKKAKATVSLEEKTDGSYLHINLGKNFKGQSSERLSSYDFGDAIVPEVAYENPDGTPIFFNWDFFKQNRTGENNAVGPIANLKEGDNTIKVWRK